MSKYPKISASLRMALSVLAELFMSISSTVSGGMLVETSMNAQVAFPQSWPALLLLGTVIGFGRAWAEVKLWVDHVTKSYDDIG